MKAWKYVKSVWRCWCRLWHLDWEHHACQDRHHWESKMETRRRLSRPEP